MNSGAVCHGAVRAVFLKHAPQACAVGNISPSLSANESIQCVKGRPMALHLCTSTTAQLGLLDWDSGNKVDGNVKAY